jgi:hypothetical protein
MSQDKNEHAISNARGWSETITALVAALECDFDRLEELRDERMALAQAIADDEAEKNQNNKLNGHERAHAELALREWDEANGEELKELAETAAGDEPSYPFTSAQRMGQFKKRIRGGRIRDSAIYWRTSAAHPRRARRAASRAAHGLNGRTGARLGQSFTGRARRRRTR